MKALPDDVYTETVEAFYGPGGCSDQVLACANQTVEERESNPSICSNATDFCRSNVEGPYYDYSGRGVYGEISLCSCRAATKTQVSGIMLTRLSRIDIRHPRNDPTPPDYFVDFLNLATTQEALGVNFNYTSTSSDSVGQGFQSTGMGGTGYK